MLFAVTAVDLVCSEAKTLTGMIHVGSTTRAYYRSVPPSRYAILCRQCAVGAKLNSGQLLDFLHQLTDVGISTGVVQILQFQMVRSAYIQTDDPESVDEWLGAILGFVICSMPVCDMYCVCCVR
jgi:hypothetical protein